MTKYPNLSDLQNEYDTMVAIAISSLKEGLDLSPQFQSELSSLMRLVKELGGRV
jgi:hypothetical protein